jgi:hypothetical protein
MASANVNGGKIVETCFAIIDLPEPGGPIMRVLGPIPPEIVTSGSFPVFLVGPCLVDTLVVTRMVGSGKDLHLTLEERRELELENEEVFNQVPE